jgi:excisionase family DNA binding protein
MDSLMTLEEVSAYLRLSKDTVYRMAQAAKIPASKLGTQWRFRKSEIDAWIDKNKNTPPGQAVSLGPSKPNTEVRRKKKSYS